MAKNTEIWNELRGISPEMAKMDPKTPYEVPDGYFEGLAENIMAKATLQTETRRHSDGIATAKKPAPVRRFLQYAAAAVVIGIIGITAWMFMKDNAQTTGKSDNTLAKDMLQNVQNISDSEMAAYIDNNHFLSTEETPDPSSDIREEDVKLMLADISDEDLNQYLEQNTFKQSIN